MEGTSVMKSRKILILEEIFNSITHGVGALLSIAGLVVLLLISQNALKVTSVSIFGATLIFMYVMSTLFHSLTFTKAKKVFILIDMSSIFLLIAGTYTPFALLALSGIERVILLILIWSLAICGIVFRSVFHNKYQIGFILLYILMGWIGLSIIHPLLSVMPLSGALLLVAGGIFYTSGMIFYALQKLPFNHTIWHLFVVGGSICHFLVIYRLG